MQKEKSTPPLHLPSVPLSKTLEDIQYNRIIQKKQEIHKTQNRADTTDRTMAEIKVLQWVLLQSLSIRRRQ